MQGPGEEKTGVLEKMQGNWGGIEYVWLNAHACRR